MCTNEYQCTVVLPCTVSGLVAWAFVDYIESFYTPQLYQFLKYRDPDNVLVLVLQYVEKYGEGTLQMGDARCGLVGSVKFKPF